MQLFFVISVLERIKEKQMIAIYSEQNTSFVLTVMGHGTATSELLDIHGLEDTEKVLVCTVAGSEKTKEIFKNAKHRLMIDIPGNGIMMSVPLKSVGGGRTLDYISNNEKKDGSVPDMSFHHEMIIVILNQGFTDVVMDAARAAGAKGGTAIHAKGTGTEIAKKFLGVSLAEEKEIIIIAASEQKKAGIMKAIMENAGPDTPSGAITFSLPVSAVTGIRQLDE